MKILSQRESFAYRLYLAMSDEEYGRHASDVDDALIQYQTQQADSRSYPHYSIQNPDGSYRWNAERLAQHRDMLNHLYSKWSQGVPQEGMGMVMGGLGGSGKGTIQRDPTSQLDTGRYMTVDPDAIKEEMARRGMVPQIPGMSPMEASGLVHEEASDLAKKLADRATKERRNLLWDITMSSHKSVADRVKAMRDAGYGQVDAAFVDAHPDIARQRVMDRHRGGEEAYRSPDAGPEDLGGRWVPSGVSQDNSPTPGSGKFSRNREIFDDLTKDGQFDNTVNFDVNGPSPKVTQTSGSRWHNHPLSEAGATTYPNITGARRHRMAADDEQFSAQPTVKELVEQYTQGALDFDGLMAGVAQVGHFAPRGGDLAQAYRRAEEGPDDNAFFWVESAYYDDALTSDQVDAIGQALGQQGSNL